MLRFKDHSFLNIGHVEPTEGRLISQSESALTFGGTESFGSTDVAWEVSVSVPVDGGGGFSVRTTLRPVTSPVEVLEAMSTFETPYEYDGNEESTTVIAQQPVFRSRGGKEINGAGYVHPHWYYGRAGRAHLTYPSSSPLLAHRIAAADGSNARYTTIIGNWDFTDVHDLFAQPTRNANDNDVASGAGGVKLGMRGFKYLVGAVNWNNSLYKDPNVLVESARGLRQALIVDFARALPGGTWDAWLARGWERVCRVHFPASGRLAAHEVHVSTGASWSAASEWLVEQFNKPQGMPGFFYPENGIAVYAPGTRPKWDRGVKFFAAQWTGPLSYLAEILDRPDFAQASDRLEALAVEDADAKQKAEAVWTIGWMPQFVALLRKDAIAGVRPETRQLTSDYISRRTEFVLNPPAGSTKRGDGGMLAWDAMGNLLAARLFDREKRLAAGVEILQRVNTKLDDDFWGFNCAAEGDLVGGGQARPFGHGVAIAANMLAWQETGNDAYLRAAERFGNLTLAMHFITWNESPSLDLDTRGWAHGSTGGRDQWAQIPPWETGFALQQLAPLLVAGKGRTGFYDVLWYFARTGLAQFPKARTMKRLYKPDMSITYRPIHEIASEREFYLKLPYLAYENPWDQTLLAGYQGVEPLMISAFLGSGLVRAQDDRVQAIVPGAATYDDLAGGFDVHLWNPTNEPIRTMLEVGNLTRRAISVPAEPFTVPAREMLRVRVGEAKKS